MNVRRRSRGTLIFRIVSGVCWLILLVVVIQVGGKLGRLREENEGLKARLSSATADAPGGSGDGDAQDGVDQEALSALENSLAGVKEDLAEQQRQFASERAEARQAAAEERKALGATFAGVFHQVGATRQELEPLLVDLPAADRGHVLGKLTELEAAAPVKLVEEAPVPEIEVIPPPEDEPEEMVEEPVSQPESAPEPAEGEVQTGDEGQLAEAAMNEEPPVETKPEVTTYKVRSGDTLSHIARKYDVSVNEIMEFNGITDARKLRIGQVLKIPGS